MQSASQAVNGLGFAISPGELSAAASAVEEETLIARTGGAPTLAIGMSQIFSGATGEGLRAFWYHFAIMFEALFILTTVDAGTRVGRFMLQDTLGNVYKPFGRVSWKPGLWVTSAVVVAAWGYFLYAGVTNPLGGINQLFPLFGIANQLLAAVALCVCTTLLIKSGRAEVGVGDRHPAGVGRGRDAHRELPEGVLGRPEARLLRPARQVPRRDRRRRRAAAGQVAGEMHTVVTNSTVDGVLAALFAVLIIIVLARRHARVGEGDPRRASRCRVHRGAVRGVADHRARPGCSGPRRSRRWCPATGRRSASERLGARRRRAMLARRRGGAVSQ